MNGEKRYTTVAKVVSIATTQDDLSGKNSHSTKAFVEFTDYKGQPARGFFPLSTSPLYTTIRTNCEVNIVYSESKFLDSYTVFLLNPELYKRTPTEEELAPYRRNKKRVLKQSLMGTATLFVTVVLYGITKSILVIVAAVIATYFIMMYGSDQEKADADKKLSWHDQK